MPDSKKPKISFQATVPEVIIGVRGGVAEIDRKPAGVRLIIRDYDSGECDEDCPEDCTEHEFSEFIAEAPEIWEPEE